LRQYFETSSVQRLLQRSGWVDKSGRIVDLDKFKGKLNIIEQAPLLPSQHAGCFLPAALFQRFPATRGSHRFPATRGGATSCRRHLMVANLCLTDAYST
jgi:hypothetical protein